MLSGRKNNCSRTVRVVHPLLQVGAIIFYSCMPMEESLFSSVWLLDPFQSLPVVARVALSSIFLMGAQWIGYKQMITLPSSQKQSRDFPLFVRSVLLCCFPSLWLRPAWSLSFCLFVLIWYLYGTSLSAISFTRGGFLFGVCAILEPCWVFLLFPVFILGIFIVKAGSLRNISGFLIGTFTPMILALPLFLQFPWKDVREHLYNRFQPVFLWELSFRGYEEFWIPLGLLILVLIGSIFCIFGHNMPRRYETAVSLRLSGLFCFPLFFCVFFPSSLGFLAPLVSFSATSILHLKLKKEALRN